MESYKDLYIHDLDEYWQTIGFSSKQRATTILKKHFKCDRDYLVQTQTIHRPDNSTRIDKYFINDEAINFLRDYGARRKNGRESRKAKAVELLSDKTVERYAVPEVRQSAHSTLKRSQRSC